MKKSKRILKKHVMRYQYPILNLDEFHLDNWRKVIWSIYGHKSKKLSIIGYYLKLSLFVRRKGTVEVTDDAD